MPINKKVLNQQFSSGGEFAPASPGDTWQSLEAFGCQNWGKKSATGI